MGEMPKHYIRCPDKLWVAAQSKAGDQGTTTSELVRDWLTDYVGGHAPVPRQNVLDDLVALTDVIDQATDRIRRMREAVTQPE